MSSPIIHSFIYPDEPPRWAAQGLREYPHPTIRGSLVLFEAIEDTTDARSFWRKEPELPPTYMDLFPSRLSPTVLPPLPSLTGSFELRSGRGLAAGF